MNIKMKDVTVSFKNGVTAVNHVNLEIPQGIFGLLGENGAGKTTLMRVLTTVLKPSSGTVLMDDLAYSEGNYEKIRRKIGYLPQELNLYPNLTVRECLEYLGELSGLPRTECRERFDDYLQKTSGAEHQNKKMRLLPGGMTRRVGLIQALLNEPDFLIVDEPTTGLDPEERIRIRNLLVDFSKNRTVLFSTHVVEDLAAACSRLAVMKKGEFLYTGEMSELLQMAKGHIWVGTVRKSVLKYMDTSPLSPSPEAYLADFPLRRKPASSRSPPMTKLESRTIRQTFALIKAFVDQRVRLAWNTLR